MSHYLPAFVQTNGTHQMAVCGRFIRETDHSPEPTCPRCAGWLARESDDEAQLFADLGYVELRPGVMGPPQGTK